MMSARDIATIINRIRKAERMPPNRPGSDVMKQQGHDPYDKAIQDFDKAGYAAESRRSPPAASLGLPQRSWAAARHALRPAPPSLAHPVLNADTLILDEPTNHLDADSIEWLRGA